MMNHQSTKPHRRFKGFTGDWVQRKFGDFAQRQSENRMSDNDVPSVEYEDVVAGQGILNKELRNKEVNKTGIVFSEADVLYGKLRPYLHNWLNPDFKGVAVGDWWVLKPQDMDKNFLYRLIQTPQFDDAANQSSGTKMPRADWNLISDLKFRVPNSIEEQAKIVKHFSNLDNLITLYQRKADKLNCLKKAYLSEMFPAPGEKAPRRRFAGFTGDWEQQKLSDIVDVMDGDRGKNYPTEADFSEQGHTLFLNASNVTNQGFAFNDTQFITEDKSNSMGNGKLQLDDIVLTSRGSLGHIAWYNAAVMNQVPYARINSGMLILRKKSNINTSYIHQYMKSAKGQGQISFMSFGSAQPQLTKKGVEGLKVQFPKDLAEQEKLGDYFATLDNLIALHQRKLAKLRALKRAYLAEMFV